jgi:sterol desaturase/sphingolipid hydroxylase (fatty acid hydroxylase superfamily)
MSEYMVLIVIVIGILIERIRPALHCPIRGVIFNIVYWFPATFLQTITVGGVVMLTNMLVGGVIILPSKGWLLVPAIAAFVIVMDFSEYVFHRLQHRIPVLWALHSFHHSDETMNLSTTYRHFWADQALKAMSINLLVGLLFQANPPVLLAYSGIMLCNLFFHMNVPIGLGRCWLLLNSPQYHRIHHSSLTEHQDRNFAALFPIFDAIFRTAHRPQAGEFPATGLYDQDKPRDMIEALIWPVRGTYRAMASWRWRRVPD